MKITEQLLEQGKSSKGNWTKRQIELLGLVWPPTKGWCQSIIGREISEQDAAEFVALAGMTIKAQKRQARTSAQPGSNGYWFDAEEPVEIFLYVLKLEGGHYYVGLTDNPERRLQQHQDGVGASWTRLHRPVAQIQCFRTGLHKQVEAERLESAVTLSWMQQYGVDKVRGGYFSNCDQVDVDKQLRGHGAWDMVKQGALSQLHFDTSSSWHDAIEAFLSIALDYYDAGAPADREDDVFAACYRLTRYRLCQPSFEPCLTWAFWNKKGILPVLMSFKHKRPVSSGHTFPFEVLGSAMARGRDGHPLRRLFLLGWLAYHPPCTDNQAKTLSRFLTYLDEPVEYDRQYDDFVSVLFPEMRGLLRGEIDLGSLAF